MRIRRRRRRRGRRCSCSPSQHGAAAQPPPLELQPPRWSRRPCSPPAGAAAPLGGGCSRRARADSFFHPLAIARRVKRNRAASIPNGPRGRRPHDLIERHPVQPGASSRPDARAVAAVTEGPPLHQRRVERLRHPRGARDGNQLPHHAHHVAAPRVPQHRGVAHGHAVALVQATVFGDPELQARRAEHPGQFRSQPPAGNNITTAATQTRKQQVAWTRACSAAGAPRPWQTRRPRCRASARP